MFTSLECKAKRNYQACGERGELMLKKDSREDGYDPGTSMSFWDLNAKFCGLKQVP